LHSFLVRIHLLLIPYNQLPPLHESKLKDWEFRWAFIFWSCMEVQHWCDRLSCRHNKLCSGPENESPSRYKKFCSSSVNSCNSRVMSNWLCFTPKRSEWSGELYTDWCKDHVVELTANDMVAHFTILLS
jgi:hypothetical protein